MEKIMVYVGTKYFIDICSADGDYFNSFDRVFSSLEQAMAFYLLEGYVEVPFPEVQHTEFVAKLEHKDMATKEIIIQKQEIEIGDL
jgi:hypothetical protein